MKLKRLIASLLLLSPLTATADEPALYKLNYGAESAVEVSRTQQSSLVSVSVSADLLKSKVSFGLFVQHIECELQKFRGDSYRKLSSEKWTSPRTFDLIIAFSEEEKTGYKIYDAMCVHLGKVFQKLHSAEPDR